MYHATISSFNKPERLDSKLQREANNLLSILKEYYVLLLHKQHGSNISLIHTLARCIESLLVIGCMVSSLRSPLAAMQLSMCSQLGLAIGGQQD